ncbi:Uncharacterized protein GBIM_11527 [Gryllus bimaculatus]|nr:Uncharacterized protein GBIM_11527 [Gryllus bimaculatus]
MSSRFLPRTVYRVVNCSEKIKGRGCSIQLSPKSLNRYQFPRAMANVSGRERKLLTMDNLNPCVKSMEYVLSGPLVSRAAAIEKELEQGAKKPFKEVINAVTGDLQAMGQPPITFTRQVLALVSYPELIKYSNFPDDVKERAKFLLAGCSGGSTGSYSEASGVEIVRRRVAAFIEERDGFSSNWQDIILCAGASTGIKAVLKLLDCETSGLKTGVMVPIPHYPLFPAVIADFNNMQQMNYYLDESNGWAISIKELKRALNDTKGTCKPRALVVINPGNPTGQVLTKNTIREIINFAYEEGLFLIADEVHQQNIYDNNSEFHSFKKVLMEMGLPYSKMELASFMSSSKGYMGECGMRGGYAEVINLQSGVKAMYLKSISANLCSTVLGQIAMDCVVKPPEPGGPSYKLFVREKNSILKMLTENAKIAVNTFNSIEGMSCNVVQGAVYAFPQIYLPSNAIEIAKQKQMHPDEYYASQLLENTGISIVPGSGFGQKDGTYHFRQDNTSSPICKTEGNATNLTKIS